MKYSELTEIAAHYGFSIRFTDGNSEPSGNIGEIVLSMCSIRGVDKNSLIPAINAATGSHMVKDSFRRKINGNVLKFNELQAICDKLGFQMLLVDNPEENREPNVTLRYDSKTIVKKMIRFRHMTMKILQEKYNEEAGTNYVHQSFSYMLREEKLRFNVLKKICYLLHFSIRVYSEKLGVFIECKQDKYGIDEISLFNLLKSSTELTLGELSIRMTKVLGETPSKNRLRYKSSVGNFTFDELQAICGILGYAIEITDDLEKGDE